MHAVIRKEPAKVMGSRWRCQVWLVVILCVGFSGAVNAQPAPRTVVLSMPHDAAAPLKFGADALRVALAKEGLQVREGAAQSSADLAVILTVKGAAKTHAADKAESYAISLSPDKRIIYIDGSDATGAMYGELDLAEQVGWGDISQVEPVSKSPYLEIRGVNMFLTVQDIDTPEGAFWSDEYWKIYLDTMARSRYNFLDIHGPCDAVDLSFPNGFAYFVSLPDFPEVGVGAQRAAKNLARLRQVIAMAADRGIKVGYMNYEATLPIGPWKTRKFGVDERWVNVPQEFITGPRVETYTREAVLSLLKQLPASGCLVFG